MKQILFLFLLLSLQSKGQDIFLNAGVVFKDTIVPTVSAGLSFNVPIDKNGSLRATMSGRYFGRFVIENQIGFQYKNIYLFAHLHLVKTFEETTLMSATNSIGMGISYRWKDFEIQGIYQKDGVFLSVGFIGSLKKEQVLIK